VTGTINELPGATIPIDIGETSSTELPVAQPEETPPVMRTPERAKPPRDSKNKLRHPTRHAKAIAKRASKIASKVKRKPAPKPQPAAQLTLFEVLFGSFRSEQRPAAVNTLGGAGPALPPEQANAAAN
jgi:cell division septation protein DedD